MKILSTILTISFMYACGPRRLTISSIADEVQEDFDVISSGLNGEVNIERNDNGIKIIVDSDKIQKIADTGTPSTGYYDDEAKEIVLPSLTQRLHDPDGYEYLITKPERRVAMAHEIGHALGLVHVDHGLMQPHIAVSCLGLEAKCLIDALHDQGK